MSIISGPTVFILLYMLQFSNQSLALYNDSESFYKRRDEQSRYLVCTPESSHNNLLNNFKLDLESPQINIREAFGNQTVLNWSYGIHDYALLLFDRQAFKELIRRQMRKVPGVFKLSEPQINIEATYYCHFEL